MEGHEGREPPVVLGDRIVARRARLQESLATAAGTLASPLPPDEIVSRLVGAYTRLLEPVVCGVALVDPDQLVMTTVSSQNTPKLAPMPVSEVPGHIVSLLGETWALDKRPVDLPDDPWLADLLGARQAGVGWYLALPLLCEGHTRGGVLLGFDAGTDVDAEERAAAHSLAAIGTAALERHALLADLEEAARERAVAAERERFASDLHDTAGQLFVALGLLARRLAEEMPPDSPWLGQVLHLADLADRGNDQIDHAIRALAFLPVAKQGLHPSLRALAQSMSEDSGLDISVTVDGRVARLPAPAEQALYRVVHEAIANAWRHARCETIRVELAFDPHEVAVRVVDDGVGIHSCDPDGGLHLGITSMHRAIEEIGGTVKIEPATPHGTVVEARTRRTSR